MTIPIRAGGCIRFSDATPTWHVNTAHSTVGVDLASLHVNELGMVQFDLTPPKLPVVAAIAVPDESLASRGIVCGVSGGVEGCRIQFHQAGFGDLDLNDPAHYARIRSSGSNVWFLVAGHVEWPTESVTAP